MIGFEIKRLAVELTSLGFRARGVPDEAQQIERIGGNALLADVSFTNLRRLREAALIGEPTGAIQIGSGPGGIGKNLQARGQRW